MRAALVVALVAVGGASAGAAPPTLTPTGELEPQEVCVTYTDFTHAVQGSVPDGLADSIMTSTFDSKKRVKAERWWRIDAPVRIVDHSYDAFGRKAKTRTIGFNWSSSTAAAMARSTSAFATATMPAVD